MTLLEILRDYFIACQGMAKSEHALHAGYVSKRFALSCLRFKSNRTRYPEINNLQKVLCIYSGDFLPIDFIEKNCLHIIATDILEKYPLHISESYALACVALYPRTGYHLLKHRVAGSHFLEKMDAPEGLLTEPAVIAEYLLDDLDVSNLITIDSFNMVNLGPEITAEDIF